MQVDYAPASLIVRARLSLQNARDSLWFLPAILVAASIALALVLLRVDAHIDGTRDRIWWLFAGNADSARTVLSVIAGSLITVVAVAFSVTVIAIQQASNQFSPRILRNFTRDRGNQVVLGSYIATFVFALLVLRRVREASDGLPAFVPSIAITSAVVLSLISFGLLVYFIHHVTRTLEVTVLLSTIGRELVHELGSLFPKELGDASEEPSTLKGALHELPPCDDWDVCEVRSQGHGYLRIIDHERIEHTAKQSELRAVVLVAIGDFVQKGELLARISSPEALPEHLVETFRAAFNTDEARSVEQDPLFAIQQIVDMALKALSPGINDSTTAIQCIDQLGNAMAFLLEREFPRPERTVESSSVFFTLPSLTDYLSACFGPIRRAARTELRVSTHLVRVLGKLAARVERQGRVSALRHQLDETAATFAWDPFTQHEQDELRQRIASIRAQLDERLRACGAAESSRTTAL